MNEVGTVQLTSWDRLHTLGRASALARRGAGRRLAQHWGSVKYNQALTGRSDGYMGLSNPIPPLQLLVVALVGLAAGAVAGIRPARRASRLNVLRGIATE
ncbi:hypothetical protein [Streptomyces nigrescens]